MQKQEEESNFSTKTAGTPESLRSLGKGVMQAKVWSRVRLPFGTLEWLVVSFASALVFCTLGGRR